VVRDRLPRPSSRPQWALVVVATAILVGSLVPPPGQPSGVPRGDDIVHLVAYAVFGLALGAARAAPTGPGRVRRAVGVFLATVAYGTAIELLQAPIPWRRFGGGDLLANAAGAALAAVWTALGPHIRRAVGRETD